MSARDRWIQRHLRRLHFGQFLQRAGEWVGGYLCVFGSLVLIVKLLVPALWPHVLWLGLGAIPAAAVAWRLSRQGRFTRPESVALLDRSLGAGGLLMTLSEASAADWETRLPQMEQLWRDSLPRIRPRRFSYYVGLPLLFAAAVCLLPQRELPATDVAPRTVARQAAEQLKEMLKLVEEVQVFDEQQTEELREEIAKLAEETRDAPLTHEKWETVDALEQRMRLKLDESLAQADQAAAAVAVLAEAAAGELDSLSPERREQLEQEVLEALQKLQQSGSLKGAPKALQDALQRLSKNGASPQRLPENAGERSEMLDDLQQFLKQEQRKLAEARKKCQGHCHGEGKEGGECQSCGAECAGGLCSECQGLSSRDGDGRPGRGGINRGRADAEMSWGEESDRQGAKFKETVLPPGFQEDPQDDVRGVSLAPPETDPASAAPRSAARQIEAASGRETWDRRLRPRHREVVRQYFDTANDRER
jgi:hypothetical protein